jgi:hypothetical protein
MLRDRTPFSPRKHYETPTEPRYNHDGPGAMAINHEVVYKEQVEAARAALPARRFVDGRLVPRDFEDAVADGIAPAFRTVMPGLRGMAGNLSDMAAELADAFRHWQMCDMPSVKSPYGRTLGPEYPPEWHAARVRCRYDIFCTERMRLAFLGDHEPSYFVCFMVACHGVQAIADEYEVSVKTINNWKRGEFTPADRQLLHLSAPVGTRYMMRWLLSKFAVAEVDPRFGLPPYAVSEAIRQVRIVLAEAEAGRASPIQMFKLCGQLHHMGFAFSEVVAR